MDELTDDEISAGAAYLDLRGRDHIRRGATMVVFGVAVIAAISLLDPPPAGPLLTRVVTVVPAVVATAGLVLIARGIHQRDSAERFVLARQRHRSVRGER